VHSLPFIRLVHADWSKTPAKRWAAQAKKSEVGWEVEAPRLVGPVDAFLRTLMQEPQPTLAGFDFPIGVPASFGQKTGFSGFIEAIEHFGSGPWSRFYDVAERAEEIALHRPFYPYRPSSTRHQHLVDGHGVCEMSALMRQCEKVTRESLAACSLFWTLGPKQVGKAAISGWREVIRPARRAGALLWPFDGQLLSLSQAGKLVICETYPAEAYGQVDVSFRSGGGKKKQDYRREATSRLASRCASHAIKLSDQMRNTLSDGFGAKNNGDDAFDAAIGLFGMIEVVEGRREASPTTMNVPEWEGWILGRLG